MAEIIINTDDETKARMLKVLADEPIDVVSQAYVYAKNLDNFGVDVGKQWYTVMEQSDNLRKAYDKGRSDMLEEINRNVSDLFKTSNRGEKA